MVPNGIIWPSELNQKVFPRNISYRERLKGPPFSFFGIVRLFSKIKFPQRVPLQFFDVLRQNGCWKIPGGPLFRFFWHCETFFWIFFHQRVPASIFATMDVRSFGFSVSLILFLWVWYFEFFDTFMSFCCFWASDMAPTYAVPGLLYFCWRLVILEVKRKGCDVLSVNPTNVFFSITSVYKACCSISDWT